MERIWLGVWVLSECVVLPACLLSHYYFVGQRLSWTEAQTYCRQTHTDLATIRNYEEVNQLTSTLSSAGYFSDVWIGLYNEIDWQWSDGFTGTGTDYRDWSTENYQPNFYASSEFCVVMGYTGQWWDVDCTESFPVFCYKGTPLDPEYVHMNVSMDWSSAQRLCRENFTDLATVRNLTENQMLFSLRSTIHSPLIGLFRDPNLYWSDGSSFSFTNWDDFGYPIGTLRTVCGVTSSQRSGMWKFSSCQKELPFVCYSLPVMEWTVKLRLKTEDSVDLNDPVVNKIILKKLQDRLMENGMGGATLKWKKHPDGEVFQKEIKTEI